MGVLSVDLAIIRIDFVNPVRPVGQDRQGLGVTTYFVRNDYQFVSSFISSIFLW
jgi:hypothetical protein